MTILLRIFCAVLALGLLSTTSPANAAPPLEIYGRLPALEMASISPSGNRIAMIGIVDNTRSLTVIENRQAIIRTPLGDQKLRSISWAGEDRLLLRMSAIATLGIGFTTDRVERSAYLVVPLNGEPSWWVFEGYRNVTGGVSGFFGIMGAEHRLGYFSGITVGKAAYGEAVFDDGRPELYQVDLFTRKTKLIAHRPTGPDAYRDWTVGPDGSVQASLDFFSSAGEWRIRNGDDKMIASGAARTGGVSLIGLGRTPGTVLYLVPAQQGTPDRLLEQPLAGGAATDLLTSISVSGYHVDQPSQLLIGYVEEGDVPTDHFFDARREKVMAATRKAFPGLSVTLEHFDDAFVRLIVRTNGPGDPDTWWLVDTAAKSAVVLSVAYPLEPTDVGPMRMVRYKAADGLDIGGVLTLPPGRPAHNLPVILLPHGGPAARDYPVFDWWAQAFASRGYAVFQPNFRGSSGLGQSFQEAGWGEWGRKSQTDISDGLAMLVRDGIVDPRRACIVGASYGGYAALAGVTVQQGLYRCAVSVAGVSDIAEMVRDDKYESGQDATLSRGLKREVGSGRDLRAVSPFYLADRADAPILLIHGADDTRVPFKQSSNMVSALKRAGKPVDLITLPGEDHFLSRSETRLTMLKAAIAFVEKHNPPASPPAAK